MYTQTIADPGEAFYRRVKDDSVLKALTVEKDSGSAGVFPGWPHDELQSHELPRVTYLPITNTQPGGGIADGRIQVDIWVWPDPGVDKGGRGQLLLIYRRLLQLCSRTWWTDTETGNRINAATAGPLREWPSARDDVMRGTFEIFLGVN